MGSRFLYLLPSIIIVERNCELTKEARTRLLHHLKVAYMKRDRTFGNASFAKTIIEGLKRNLDLRMSRLDDGATDKRLITEMDLNYAIL